MVYLYPVTVAAADAFSNDMDAVVRQKFLLVAISTICECCNRPRESWCFLSNVLACGFVRYTHPVQLVTHDVVALHASTMCCCCGAQNKANSRRCVSNNSYRAVCIICRVTYISKNMAFVSKNHGQDFGPFSVQGLCRNYTRRVP